MGCYQNNFVFTTMSSSRSPPQGLLKVLHEALRKKSTLKLKFPLKLLNVKINVTWLNGYVGMVCGDFDLKKILLHVVIVVAAPGPGHGNECNE